MRPPFSGEFWKGRALLEVKHTDQPKEQKDAPPTPAKTQTEKVEVKDDPNAAKDGGHIILGDDDHKGR